MKIVWQFDTIKLLQRLNWTLELSNGKNHRICAQLVRFFINPIKSTSKLRKRCFLYIFTRIHKICSFTFTVAVNVSIVGEWRWSRSKCRIKSKHPCVTQLAHSSASDNLVTRRRFSPCSNSLHSACGCQFFFRSVQFNYRAIC